MCVTIRSLPFTTGVKPISLSGFNCRVRIGSHRKNLIFAPCAAAMGFLLAHSAVFVLYCKKQQGCLIQFCCCNLSPRGDGNSGKIYSETGMGLQFIPARGRKQRGVSELHQASELQLIPARGRKCVGLRSQQRQCCCNLSPRGDGNVNHHLDDRLKLVATYPREGTETLSGIPCFPPFNGCNLSPRGDGNTFFKTRPMGNQSCNLSPRGDGNSLLRSVYSE